MTSSKKKQIKIVQIASATRRDKRQALVLKGLGLGRIGKSVMRNDSPEILGMVNKISHLVQIVAE